MKVGKYYYIDFMAFGMPNVISDAAWRYLYKHSAGNPEVNHISESVTNWVQWFNESDPNIRLLKMDKARLKLMIRGLDDDTITFVFPG